MKPRVASLVLLYSLLTLPAAVAATHGAHFARRSAGHNGTAHPTSTIRPNYGGGHHTTSHGGNYLGETNAHHKNGHYKNLRSANRYGVHKPHS